MGSTTQGRLVHSVAGDHETIQVWEKEGRRWLDFGDGAVQTIIDLDQVGALPSPVNQAMLACLMFVSTPKTVALLGGGGGVLARYFQYHDKTIKGDVVEQSQCVADIARQYFDIPGESQGWRLVVDQAQVFILSTQVEYDVMILDIAENARTPQWAIQTNFLGQCRKRLSPQGVLVINLMVDGGGEFKRALSNIRNVFEKRTLCLSVPGYKNIQVLAFNVAPAAADPSVVLPRLSGLNEKWGLAFDRLLEQIDHDNPRGSGIF